MTDTLEQTLAGISALLKINPNARVSSQIRKQLDIVADMDAKINGTSLPNYALYVDGWKAKRAGAAARAEELAVENQHVFNNALQAKADEAVRAGNKAQAEGWWAETMIWPDGDKVEERELSARLSSLLQFVLPNYHDYLLMASGTILQRTAYSHEQYDYPITIPTYDEDGNRDGTETYDEIVPAGTVYCWQPISASVVTDRILAALGSTQGSVSVTHQLQEIYLAECNDSLKDGPLAQKVKSWLSQARSTNALIEHLPRGAAKVVANYLFPITFEASRLDQDRAIERTQLLDLRTGRIYPHNGPENPDHIIVGKPVKIQLDLLDLTALFPEDTDEQFDRRYVAMRRFVDFHFPKPDEREAFFRELGIAMFSFGQANHLHMQGAGGSGKDLIMSFINRTLGNDFVMLNPKAVDRNGDEENDLVRAGMSRCLGINVDGVKADVSRLKTLTGGGSNPITARAKYAPEAVEVRIMSTLVTMGNEFIQFGSVNPEGLTRRISLLPITKKLPERMDIYGFKTWDQANMDSDPWLLCNVWAAFQRWVAADRPGFSDTRLRMPARWVRMQEEEFRNLFPLRHLLDFLTPVTEPADGMLAVVLPDVCEAIMRAFGARINSKTLITDLGVLFSNAQFTNGDGPMRQLERRYPLALNEAAVETLDREEDKMAISMAAGLLVLPS